MGSFLDSNFSLDDNIDTYKHIEFFARPIPSGNMNQILVATSATTAAWMDVSGEYSTEPSAYKKMLVDDREYRAARKIQALWRGYFVRSRNRLAWEKVFQNIRLLPGRGLEYLEARKRWYKRQTTYNCNG